MPIYNFAAGPAVLPAPILQQVQAELLDYQGSHMSILEISHRSSLFTELYAQAKERLLNLLELSDDYEVLFLQGGATLQFTMVPLNLAVKHHRIAIAQTGHWAARAVEEARRLPDLTVDVVTDAGPDYTTIPALPALPKDQYDYLHLTTNNTIYGTAYHQLPATSVPLVGDLSSNFLGQQYPFDQFDLIYAGAQKNLAPAGVTIVVVKKSRLAQVPAGLPSMLDYAALAKKDSALNTPPVFQIYVAALVLKWLQDQGGVASMAAENTRKAQVLYDFLAQSRLFNNPVAPAARSLTNIPFVTGDAALDAAFLAEATAAGLLNLKGHRSVGGMRASLYNAMPYEGVVALRDFMVTFEKHH